MNGPLTAVELLKAIRDQRGCTMTDAKKLYDAFIVEQAKGGPAGLRDEFAGRFLQGYVAKYGVPGQEVHVAVYAYQMANAMLEARKA